VSKTQPGTPINRPWSLRDHLSLAILRLHLWSTGTRHRAAPFDRWMRRCPACGGRFAGHETAAIGGAPLPATEFLAAAGNGDWVRAVELGRSGRLMGRDDVAIVSALRCPATERILAFAYVSPFGFAGPRLQWQQILNDKATAELLPHVPAWQPAMIDALEDMRSRLPAERRQLRSQPLVARLRSFVKDRFIP
jgi:hypothetical protein